MLKELLMKNRSFRGYDESFRLTRAELLELVDLTRYTASSVNQQPLKYYIASDPEEVKNILPLTMWAKALKEMSLPHPGMGPSAFIIICQDMNISPNTTRFQRDVGIAAQTILLGAVEKYGRDNGMEIIHGPWGFNDTDREGMLTEGFDRRATYATNYSYDYYPKLIEVLGFVPESEWVEYNFKIPEAVDPRLERIAKYVSEKTGLREVAEDDSMKKLIKHYGYKVLTTMNEAYAKLDCFVPLEGREMDNVLDQFATVINPRYLSVLVDKNDDVVAVGVIIPSLCSVLQKSRGRMTPCAILGLLRAIKHPKELEMVLVAVREDYQKKGVNAIMMARIARNIIEDKIEHVESNPELVTNIAVQAQWDVFEREIVKKRCTYVKAI